MLAVRKYTLLLASFAMFSFVNTVTATDYEPDKTFDNSGYSYDDLGYLGETSTCAFQFTSYDGDLNCVSGEPSGWNRPKSDYWHSENSFEVIASS